MIVIGIAYNSISSVLCISVCMYVHTNKIHLGDVFNPLRTIVTNS